jgi:ubiquinone/menaquinone biosynthesis C-methylase UbiE
MRTGRQKYYDVFAHVYDVFVQLHAGRHRDETRKFLVDSSQLDNTGEAIILDICCGTGAVILAFSEKYSDALAIGYDFSSGMLKKAKQKAKSDSIALVLGDAATLAFRNDCFDVVCCSHALYELKGQVRNDALVEMKRVVKPDGKVLIMEHEVPRNPMVRQLFDLRMLMMGSADSKEFLRQDLSPYEKVFTDVTLSHTPSGKSKLIICRKK